jgi:hypothetical protein
MLRRGAALLALPLLAACSSEPGRRDDGASTPTIDSVTPPPVQPGEGTAGPAAPVAPPAPADSAAAAGDSAGGDSAAAPPAR